HGTGRDDPDRARNLLFTGMQARGLVPAIDVLRVWPHGDLATGTCAGFLTLHIGRTEREDAHHVGPEGAFQVPMPTGLVDQAAHEHIEQGRMWADHPEIESALAPELRDGVDVVRHFRARAP